MARAVFTTKVSPAYDDLPEQRYHFPKRYFRAAEVELSSSGGRQSYFATARLVRIEDDQDRRLKLPRVSSDRPHPSFLKYHREQVFGIHT